MTTNQMLVTKYNQLQIIWLNYYVIRRYWVIIQGTQTKFIWRSKKIHILKQWKLSKIIKLIKLITLKILKTVHKIMNAHSIQLKGMIVHRMLMIAALISKRWINMMMLILIDWVWTKIYNSNYIMQKALELLIIKNPKIYNHPQIH